MGILNLSAKNFKKALARGAIVNNNPTLTNLINSIYYKTDMIINGRETYWAENGFCFMQYNTTYFPFVTNFEYWQLMDENNNFLQIETAPRQRLNGQSPLYPWTQPWVSLAFNRTPPIVTPILGFSKINKQNLGGGKLNLR